MIKNTLLLASKSYSRQKLLREVQIPFAIIGQDADETLCDWGLPLEQLVSSIAKYKMQHALLPAGKEGDTCFVLTADTLSQDLDGTINGKPLDRADAIAMIKRARHGSRLVTAFCLERKKYREGNWKTEKRIEKCVTANYIFDIPDHWIEQYLASSSIALSAANAITIEEYGSQFLKSIDGSYSAIVGLPLYELRQALEQVGFY